MQPARHPSGPFLALALTLLFSSGGCAELDPAPDDLDGLFHFAWTHYADGLDAELAEAVVHAHAAVDGDHLDGPLQGTISDLTRDDLDAVGMPADTDPERPVGLYLVNPVPCTLDQVVAITTDPDQGGLYPGEFDAFSRELTSDEGAFHAGDEPQLTWEDEIHDGLMADDYVKVAHGGARLVPQLDAERSPWGPILLGRMWLPEPAEWEAGSDYYWDQDYQLDLYWEASPGSLVHIVGLWRSVGMGATTSEDEFMQSMILSVREGWDERTAELCASGDF